MKHPLVIVALAGVAALLPVVAAPAAVQAVAQASKPVAAATQAPALDVDSLMRALGGVAERHAAFEETRRMAVLTQPLVRRGTLDYVRPDRLELNVVTPYFEHVTVAADTVTVERSTGTSRIALAGQPSLAAWIESLRATLAGDGPSLAAHFDVALAGVRDAWTLTLVPRDAALHAVIASIVVSGRGAEPLRFAIDEVRGDSTVVDIVPRKAP